jgi:hypothetical protein
VPFLGDGDARRCLPLPLGLGRAQFGRLGLLGPLAQRVAREPADPELEGEDEEETGRMAGDLVDDGCRSAENDGQPHGRLQRVAQVSEQERGCHPDDDQAADERDQLPVDERDPRREQPVRRRAGERKAAAREEREHQCRDGRYGEPHRRRRCIRRVASEREVEQAHGRQEDDRPLEPVLTRELSDPAHALKVLQARACRLLPK